MPALGKVARADSFQLPSRLAADHEPSVLRGHFVLSRGSRHAPDGWSRETFDGWTLTSEPTLPVLSLEDLEGSRLGWLVGHPIDLEGGRVLAGVARLACRGDGPDAEVEIDEELHRYGGRWVALVLRPSPLVYPDGSGSLPVLYARRLETVASSPLTSPGMIVPP